MLAVQASVNLGKFSCSVCQQERKLQVSAGGSGGPQGAEEGPVSNGENTLQHLIPCNVHLPLHTNYVHNYSPPANIVL